MLISKVVPVPAMGITLLHTGTNTNKVFELLNQGRAVVQTLPAELNDRADGFVLNYVPTIKAQHELKLDMDLYDFFSNEKVRKLIGSCKFNVDRINRCQLSDAKYCDKNLKTRKVQHSYVRVCWHHDLQEEIETKLVTLSQRNLIAHGVNRVSAMLGNHDHRPLSYSELCWWSVRYKVHGLLPDHVLDKIYKMESGSKRNGVNGSKSTDARYRSFEPREAMEKLAKPVIKFEVDEDPPLAYMRNPKPSTWHSEKYLKFIRSLPCVVTGTKSMEDDLDPVVAHHLINHGEGKLGGKSHDLFTFPIRASKHTELHDNIKHWEALNGSQLLHVKNTISKALQLGAIE